jgi:signal transduction histidine kinase
MEVFAITLAVVSGICLGTGAVHLFIGLRRQGSDMKYLLFGLFALAYGGAVLFALIQYRTDFLPYFLLLNRWTGLFAGLTYISLIWFVASYTETQPLPVLAILTLLWAILIAALLGRPAHLHGEILGLSTVTLPWGEEITLLNATESTWFLVFAITQLLTVGFFFIAMFRQYRRGERGAALALGVGMLLFVAALIFDALVEAGAIDFVFASDFAFLPLAIVMSLRLSNDVIRTEEELARYRQDLEGMVEDRTVELQEVNADLTLANERLAAEITGRMQTEDALRQRVGEMAGLNRIASTLSMVTELPVALEQVCEMVADLFSAQHAYIVLPTSEDAGLQVLVGFAQRMGPVEPQPLPVPLVETQCFNRVLTQAESLALTDISSLPMAALMYEYVTAQSLQSAMLVPLVVRGTVLGLMAVATDQPDRAFSSGQLRLAETIAADVASAIENARLTEQAQAAAVSEERSRLARELHDSVTQLLFSINLIALSLGRLWKRDPQMAERSTGELQRLTRGALAEMRTLLRELRPQTIAGTELGTLLEQLSDGLAARHDIPVEVTVGQICDMPEEVHVALYRIAQEALNNITKHAEASQVNIKLACDSTVARLTINDDGQGFDVGDVPAGHMGLDIMKERAEAIGAQMVVDSQPGAGTSIAVAWPISESGGHGYARD